MSETTNTKNNRIYYRVNGWNKHFETAKSRDIGHKSWGVYPLKQGSGYCRMMTKRNGASIYGAFIAMCSIIHQKSKETRQGYLTDTGGIPGYPYDDLDISAMTRINIAIIKAAIKELILIHWLTPCDSTGKAIEGYHEDTTRIPRDPCTDSTDSTEGTDKRERFRPPTLKETQAYMKEKGYKFNPEKFMAYYTSKGWMVGKNKMKCWKSAVTGWHLREGQYETNNQASIKPKFEQGENNYPEGIEVSND